MTNLSNRNTVLLVLGLGVAVILGYLIAFNPLNTSTTHWIGPEKSAAPAGSTR